MATPGEHLAKARSHEAFLKLIPDEFPDWLATVAFYTAVELVESLLAQRGHHSQSHFDRKQALEKNYPNKQLNLAYKDLYNASLDARYLPRSHCPSAEDVRRILISKRLGFIADYVMQHSESTSE